MAKYVVRAEKSFETEFGEKVAGGAAKKIDEEIMGADRGAWDDPGDEPVVESVASRVMRPVKRVVRKRKAKG